MAKKAIKDKKKPHPLKGRKPKSPPPIPPKGNQYALGNNGGRPREWTEDLIEEKRQALLKWIANPKNYFFTSFLNQEDMHRSQLDRFCKCSPEFCAAYERALAIQEQRLVELALTRKHDGNFTKFVLANKASWKEKAEVSGDASNPLAVILDRIGATSRDPLDYDE